MTAISCTRSVSVIFELRLPYTTLHNKPLQGHLRRECGTGTRGLRRSASFSRQIKQAVFGLSVIPSHAIFPSRTQKTKTGQPCTDRAFGGACHPLWGTRFVRRGAHRRLSYSSTSLTSYRSNFLLVSRLVRCGELK
ncbi:hypothetical protein BJV78DRAFT_905547 [Lactifluus subvellereus]|nr:hypothetical protein BJV78DRAFT_905547 [Lactifluus subvellereus]